MTDVCFAPSIFVNHGGGPLPILGTKDDIVIAKSLREIRSLVDLVCLKAIILVTAHWEQDEVSISMVENPDLLFDYYNFPPETYEYKYGGRGDPVLARRIHGALSNRSIPARLDDKRGWDHGVFIPMMLIRPEADIPIVSVSLLKNQDAKQHYEFGKVLGQFRGEGVAVIGSGLSFHNMRKMKEADVHNDGVLESVKFDGFLNKVCTGNESTREGLVNWKKAPEALESHPEGKAEHLMALVVAAGAGGNSKGRNVFRTAYQNKFMISGFIWD